jgi:N-acetylneuraminic acid mutarotase
MVGDKAILAGGRYRGSNAVDIYDPATRTWTQGKAPPIELHHMQCVVVDSQLWIVSAWTGSYPREQNAGDIYIYDPTVDTWSTKQGLPADRQRGSTAVVVAGRRIYVSHGNRGGHETGDHAVSLGWLDYYDIDRDEWVTGLPDAPNPRDHTGGALIDGRKICVAGGRNGGEQNFFANLILPTDCYDITTNTWSVEADIPVGGAGGSYGTSCDGHLMIAGGEAPGSALSNVLVFDGRQWTAMPNLNVGRHGSGLAVNCRCNQIYIASGSGAQGGEPELSSVETYFAGGSDVQCR